MILYRNDLFSEREEKKWVPLLSNPGFSASDPVSISIRDFF